MGILSLKLHRAALELRFGAKRLVIPALILIGAACSSSPAPRSRATTSPTSCRRRWRSSDRRRARLPVADDACDVRRRDERGGARLGPRQHRRPGRRRDRPRGAGDALHRAERRPDRRRESTEAALNSGYHLAYLVGFAFIVVALVIAVTVLKPAPMPQMEGMGEPGRRRGPRRAGSGPGRRAGVRQSRLGTGEQRRLQLGSAPWGCERSRAASRCCSPALRRPRPLRRAAARTMATGTPDEQPSGETKSLKIPAGQPGEVKTLSAEGAAGEYDEGIETLLFLLDDYWAEALPEAGFEYSPPCRRHRLLPAGGHPDVRWPAAGRGQRLLLPGGRHDRLGRAGPDDPVLRGGRGRRGRVHPGATSGATWSRTGSGSSSSGRSRAS